MKRVGLVMLVGLFLVAGAATIADLPNALSEEEKKQGFELLFNGKDLTGWEHKGNWKVENGAIVRADKGGDLTYKVKPIPDDFELRFEWKVARGSNSGVYYRPGQYEYQILDNAAHRDGKNPRTSAASLYFCMAPSKDVTRPVGEWNEGRIICQGTVIQHWLNGVKVIDFDYTDPKWAKEVELLRRRGADLAQRGGYLHLQDHGDPVWYRSIKLRTVPKGEKLDRTPVTPAPIPPEALKYEQEVLERIEKQKKPSKKP
ncbi:MAG TPA: DUF1080 domain-containing protein [Gemmataceae bacterium]|nr:DUF1080 domain-containing protein [Gemmataceae bacterium]